jgi:hypothetical protein
VFAMKRPWVSIGLTRRRAAGRSARRRGFPRWYGTFPRVLGNTCAKNTSDTARSVRKMTSLNAEPVLRTRPVARRGKDITAFDPDLVADRATSRTLTSTVGIEYVIVNGVRCSRRAAPGTKPGALLEREAGDGPAYGCGKAGEFDCESCTIAPWLSSVTELSFSHPSFRQDSPAGSDFRSGLCSSRTENMTKRRDFIKTSASGLPDLRSVASD